MIVRDSLRCSGAPSIAGTRIGVHNVVSYARAYNQDLERVHLEALPHLTMEQIRAAMAWYDENQEEVDAILRHQRDQYERGVASNAKKDEFVETDLRHSTMTLGWWRELTADLPDETEIGVTNVDIGADLNLVMMAVFPGQGDLPLIVLSTEVDEPALSLHDAGTAPGG